MAQSQNYAGPATISGYSDAAVLDLTDIQFGAGTSVTPNNGNTLLTVIDGSGDTANINIAGTGYDTHWYVLSDGSAGTFVVDPNLAITSGVTDLSAASSDMVLFDTGTGTLDFTTLASATGFTGEIAGISGSGDVLDLAGFNRRYDDSYRRLFNANDTTTLTVVDSCRPRYRVLHLIGNYSTSGGVSWNVASDGGTGTDIYDPPTTGSVTDPSVLSTATSTATADSASGTISFADVAYRRHLHR